MRTNECSWSTYLMRRWSCGASTICSSSLRSLTTRTGSLESSAWVSFLYLAWWFLSTSSKLLLTSSINAKEKDSWMRLRKIKWKNFSWRKKSKKKKLKINFESISNNLPVKLTQSIMSLRNRNPREKEKSKLFERINLKPYSKKEVNSRLIQLCLKQIFNVFMLKMESKH